MIHGYLISSLDSLVFSLCLPWKGLVFNPATPLDHAKYVLDKIDIILLMSVNPGFGGQSFIPSTLTKLREARKMIDESGYDIRLEVRSAFDVTRPLFSHLGKKKMQRLGIPDVTTQNHDESSYPRDRRLRPINSPDHEQLLCTSVGGEEQSA